MTLEKSKRKYDEKYYIRNLNENENKWLKAQTKQVREIRKKIIKNYAEKYYGSLLSPEIAARINVKENPYPFIADYEVRGQKVWKTRKINKEKEQIPIDIEEGDLIGETYTEGAIKERIINKVERNQTVVKRAYEIHGKKCQVCGYRPELMFKKATSEDIFGLEIHHKKHLGSIGEIEINPLKDVSVLCAICHAYLHSNSTKEKLMTVDELEQVIQVS